MVRKFEEGEGRTDHDLLVDGGTLGRLVSVGLGGSSGQGSGLVVLDLLLLLRLLSSGDVVGQGSLVLGVNERVGVLGTLLESLRVGVSDLLLLGLLVGVELDVSLTVVGCLGGRGAEEGRRQRKRKDGDGSVGFRLQGGRTRRNGTHDIVEKRRSRLGRVRAVEWVS